MRDQNLEVDANMVQVQTRRAPRSRKSPGNQNLSEDLYGQSLVVGGGTKVWRILSATATLNFPNTNAQKSSDLTVTLQGAVVGDVVILGVPDGSTNIDSCFTAWVSAANTVKVRFNNYSAGAIDPASGTFRVAVIQF